MKHLKKKALMIAGLLLCALVLGAVAQPVWAAKYTFKLGHAVSEQHPYNLGAIRFKEIVEKETNGEVEINLFPNNQLGTGERDLIEGLQLGTVDMVVSSTGPMSGFEKKFMIFDFPFLFKDKAQAYSTLDGEIGQYIMGLLEKQGIKGLAWYENGFRHLTNSKRPVNMPADAQGLKLRTMENKVQMAIWRAVKADPTPMAWGEVFTALQQGTVDGQENPIPIIYTQKIYEVQKYVSLTGHVFSPSMIVMGKAKFDKLPKEYQELFLKAAQESAVYEREQITKMEEEQVEELKKLGMEINTPDKDAFREATKSVYDEFRGELGEDAKLLDQILAEN
ncbi:TRAP transporter substrate-binding protein [Aminobacterium colombiense]|uniref:TRAP transporter substrate-binding protein n=1 Tax=Aminobacterium colombiense TaxID=81468 RepID=UPI0033249D63